MVLLDILSPEKRQAGWNADVAATARAKEAADIAERAAKAAAEDRFKETGRSSGLRFTQEERNFLMGCPYWHTIDSYNTVHCKDKPVDVRIVP